MASKSLTVKQTGRKGGNATKRKWKTNKKFAAAMRKKLSAAGKKARRFTKLRRKNKPH